MKVKTPLRPWSRQGPDPRAWLEHLPALKRSPRRELVSLCGTQRRPALRRPCVAHVWQTVQRRAEWSTTPESRGFLLHCHEVLRSDQAGALAYARHVIEYERLPYEQRQRVKAERAVDFAKQAMVGNVTPAQLAYLAALGHPGPVPADRAEASQLIDALRQKRGAAMTHRLLHYPGPTPDNLACLPDALTQRPQWVLWRGVETAEEDTGEIRLNKVPYDPQTLHKASTTDPSTWGTFTYWLSR